MAPKPPALTTHHCPGRKEGHGACKETEKPYNGTTATWCQHYEFCPKHPKQPVYLHNVRSQCCKCQQEERTAEIVRRKKIEEERAKVEASRPSKEELEHQARNNRNLLKGINKQSRIQERQEATLGDTLVAAPG